jgi:hypothetical protein
MPRQIFRVPLYIIVEGDEPVTVDEVQEVAEETVIVDLDTEGVAMENGNIVGIQVNWGELRKQ